MATVVGRPALVERCFGGAYTVIDVQYPYNSPGTIARGFGLFQVLGAVVAKKKGGLVDLSVLIHEMRTEVLIWSSSARYRSNTMYRHVRGIDAPDGTSPD